MIRPGIIRDFGIANLGLSLVWLATVTSGTIVILNYESRPGENPSQLTQWPHETLMARLADYPTVVMFTHPHCPCTRASVSEFAQIVSMCRELADFRVIAFDPVDANDDWRESDLVESATAVPGVTVFWDKDGQEACRFNIKTSGHVLLYDSKGQLRFSGGITSSRGHQGSNFGRSQLVAWLRKSSEQRAQQADLLESPVFGCALVDGSEAD